MALAGGPQVLPVSGHALVRTVRKALARGVFLPSPKGSERASTARAGSVSRSAQRVDEYFEYPFSLLFFFMEKTVVLA